LERFRLRGELFKNRKEPEMLKRMLELSGTYYCRKKKRSKHMSPIEIEASVLTLLVLCICFAVLFYSCRFFTWECPKEKIP
jgi:hypothetical protein